jgi:hypothetical protein
MPTIPQVRRLIFGDEEIGMGFNSQTGLAVGTALEDFLIEEYGPAAPSRLIRLSSCRFGCPLSRVVDRVVTAPRRPRRLPVDTISVR